MKIKRNKKRKIRITLCGYALLFVIFSLSIYLASSLFLRTYNVSLSQKIQTTNKLIREYQNENDTIALEVQQLSAYDRIIAVVSEDDLVLNQNNIVTVDSSN